jgi:hypothetical protein
MVILENKGMTFRELILYITKAGEKTIEDKVFRITTDKFLYVRESNGEWFQRNIPPPVDNSQYLPIVETKAVKKKAEIK